MDGKQAANLMRAERTRLELALADFKPENGDFSPAEGMMTVAQQMHHVAHTIKWFREGAWGNGFVMDPAAFEREATSPQTYEKARKELDEAYEDFIQFLEGKSAEELAEPIADKQMMTGAPKFAVISSNNEHTAHHRGALTVYLRLLGVKPKMVYSEG